MSALLLLLALSPANAAEWADFSAAFPTFPCPDGWMACVVGDTAVSPDLERDAAGMPAPADLRVGWFELEPRATFSPFADLTVYAPNPVEPAVVAVVDRPAKERPIAPPIVEEPVKEAPTEVVAEKIPEKVAQNVKPVDPAKTPEKVPEKVPEKIPEKTAEKAKEPAPVVPKKEEELAKVVHEAPQVKPPADDATLCGDLHAVEGKAMLGTLSADQVACLGRSYDAAVKITDKDKVSRVLMSNAYSKGDLVSWEKLIQRHLSDIDQSDPDLAYKYAQHLSKSLPGRAAGVIRWSDVALERRTAWSGDVYTQRVGKLYALRTKAAQSLWEAAEAEHVKAPSDATKRKVEETRSVTKVSAREWYEYQVAAKKDATIALQVCISAASTSDYCTSR